MSMPPWALGPFELLVHAEDHLVNGGDFDRRMALISFDNAVEVAISTYLSLNPMLRGNRKYTGADKDRWMENYPGKLEFLETELQKRNLPWQVPRNHIFFAHTHRNKQYHEGSNGTPEQHVLKIIREAAIWVFGLLFDVVDVEKAIADALAGMARGPKPKAAPKEDYSKAIDRRFEMIEFTSNAFYYASKVLYETDPDAYTTIGAKLCAGETLDGEDDE